jgi:hypothetical protein
MTYLSASLDIDANTVANALTSHLGQVEIRNGGEYGTHVLTIVSTNPDAFEALAANLLTAANLLRATASAGAGETDAGLVRREPESEAPAVDAPVMPTDCTCNIDEARQIFHPDDDCPVHTLDDDPVFLDARHGE